MKKHPELEQRVMQWLAAERAKSFDLSRRHFMIGAAAVGLAGLAGQARAQAGSFPIIKSVTDRLKGSGELRIATAGGALAEAERKAFMEPFQKLTGIKIIETEGFSTAKIKAQVDTKNVEWDIVGLGRGNVLPLTAQGEYFETLDYSVIDAPGVPKEDKFPNSIALFSLATIMPYRADAFPTAPSSWKDFWDVAKFPGPRNWMSGQIGIAPQLEQALIADGVPMDKLFPLDIPRALRSLSKIKPHIVTYWNSGAQSAQLIANKETVLGMAWNGRIAPLIEQGLPVGISWSGARFEKEHMLALKGTPNYANAMKYIAFCTLPETQAHFSMLIPYGFTNKEAAAFVPKERLSLLPSAHESEGFLADDEWWGANKNKAIQAWAEWLLT